MEFFNFVQKPDKDILHVLV